MPRLLPSPIQAGELAARLGLELRGDATAQISSLASLSAAVSGSLTFYSDKKLAKHLGECKATLLLAPAETAVPSGVGHLVSAIPHIDFIRVIEQLFPPSPIESRGSSSSWVSSTADINNAVLHDFCSVGDESYVGENSVLHPHVRVGRNVRIGKNCVLFPGVTLYDDVVLGDRCTIHANTVIGSDGFGFQPTATGWLKVPQIGGVVIGDDVEIGANCAVDRGAIEDTVIGNGVKIDNLVQIAHNVRIGEHTAIAGAAGVAGSATIGARCMIGGAAMIVGHISICDDVIVSGGTLVSDSITKPGRYTAVFPFAEHRQWTRIAAGMRRSIRDK